MGALAPSGERVVTAARRLGVEAGAVWACVLDQRRDSAVVAAAELLQYDLKTGAIITTNHKAIPPVTGCWKRVRDGRTLLWSHHQIIMHGSGDDSTSAPLTVRTGDGERLYDAAVVLSQLRLAEISRDERGLSSLQVHRDLTTLSDVMLQSEPRPHSALWMDTIGEDSLAFGRSDGGVELWRVPASGAASRLAQDGHTGAVLHGAVAPGDRHLVTAGADQTVRVWSIGVDPVMYMSLSAVCSGHGEPITDVAITPDGGCVATSSRDRTIRLWGIPDGRSFAVLTGHRDWVTHLAVNPAGTHLASCSEDGTIKVWDLDSRECVGTAYGVSRFLCLAMSADTVCAGDAAGNFWMLRYGTGFAALEDAPTLS